MNPANSGTSFHKLDKAFDALRWSVDAVPYSVLSGTCRELMSQWSMQNLRKDVPAGARMDAVMYCLFALKGFAVMDHARRKTVTNANWPFLNRP